MSITDQMLWYFWYFLYRNISEHVSVHWQQDNVQLWANCFIYWMPVGNPGPGVSGKIYHSRLCRRCSRSAITHPTEKWYMDFIGTGRIAIKLNENQSLCSFIYNLSRMELRLLKYSISPYHTTQRVEASDIHHGHCGCTVQRTHILYTSIRNHKISSNKNNPW